MSTFPIHETTIAEIQAALQTRQLTVVDLVKAYLERIEKVDVSGPGLHAIVTVNPRVLEEAERLDRHFAETGQFVGRLHGVPMLVKDQAETKGIRTTFGSIAFEQYVPSHDATIVRKLKNSGAIILAKTAMCDFAAGWFSYSSITGRTRNPYDLNRESGGSSAGTSAGIAANLGLVGIGEDTGGSIRLPASFNNLYGLRVTTGLISRAGLSPLVHFQDTPGPIARNPEDLARLLDELVGFDADDAFTAEATVAKIRTSYTEELNRLPNQRFRVGVLRSCFAKDGLDTSPVNRVVETAIETLRAMGVDLIDSIGIPNLEAWIAETSLYVQQSKFDITRFLSARPELKGITFMDIY